MTPILANVARALALCSPAIVETLRAVYDAEPLANELATGDNGPRRHDSWRIDPSGSKR